MPPVGKVPSGSRLYIADSGNHTIRKLVLATGAVTTIAGSAGVSGYADGRGTSARFSWPHGLLSDGQGQLFISDSANNAIHKLDLASGEVSTVAGSASHGGFADGSGDVARFCDPDALTADGNGEIFIADMGNHMIRKLDVATGRVTTVVGSPDHSRVRLGHLPAGLNQPRGMVYVPNVGLFILDSAEHAVLLAGI